MLFFLAGVASSCRTIGVRCFFVRPTVYEKTVSVVMQPGRSIVQPLGPKFPEEQTKSVFVLKTSPGDFAAASDALVQAGATPARRDPVTGNDVLFDNVNDWLYNEWLANATVGSVD